MKSTLVALLLSTSLLSAPTLPEIKYEIYQVINKRHIPRIDNQGKGAAIGLIVGMMNQAPGPGIVYGGYEGWKRSVPERNYLLLFGKSGQLQLDDKSYFDQFKEGDILEVGFSKNQNGRIIESVKLSDKQKHLNTQRLILK